MRQNVKHLLKRAFLFLFAIALLTGSFAVAIEKKTKVLVVYYSLHGTTEKVAQEIQKETSGTLFEITMVEPFTQSDREISSIAKEQRKTNKLPDIASPLPNLSQYDVIFIGGPVWSGTLPTPLMTFLQQVDFSGKTVVPFWTDAGSPGNYEADFSKSISKCKVLNGLGFSGVNSMSKSNLNKQVKDWILKLNIR